MMPQQQQRKHTQRSSRTRTTFLLCGIVGSFLWTAYALRTGTLRLPFMSSQRSSTPSNIDTNTPFQPIIPSNDISSTATSSKTAMVKLQDLPQSYLPKIGHHTPKERLIVVGDVHGMLSSLEELLAKVKFDKKHDHLILAGDMISKGPDSKGVVDLARKLGATGIRGNHEDRVLAAYKRWSKFDVEDDEDDGEVEGDDEVLLNDESEDDVAGTADDVKAAGKRKKDRKLIKHLGRRRLRWLTQCPVILRVGTLGDMGEVVVVHAGLAPGVELKKQDPAMVMNMRTILPSGKITDGREGTPWIKVCLSSLDFLLLSFLSLEQES